MILLAACVAPEAADSKPTDSAAAVDTAPTDSAPPDDTADDTTDLAPPPEGPWEGVDACGSVAFGASGPDADMVVQVSLDVIDATIAGTPVPAEVEIGTDQGSVRIQRHLRADQVCT